MDPSPDSHVSVLSLRCVDCDRRWDDPVERWRVYLTDDDPHRPEPYCPACSLRRYGD